MILNIKQDKLNSMVNDLKNKLSKMTEEDIRTLIQYELNDIYNSGLYSKYGNIYLYYREVLKHANVVINDMDINI